MRFFKAELLEPERVQFMVYDPKSENVIATFENGTTKTDDDSIADRLLQLGYEEIKEHAEEEKPQGKVETKKFVCDICGYPSDTGAGLASHKRFQHKD